MDIVDASPLPEAKERKKPGRKSKYASPEARAQANSIKAKEHQALIRQYGSLYKDPIDKAVPKLLEMKQCHKVDDLLIVRGIIDDMITKIETDQKV